MSKFYLIESRLEEFFGFKPITAVDPDQSVARGAAIYHYLLKHNQIAKGKRPGRTAAGRRTRSKGNARIQSQPIHRVPMASELLLILKMCRTFQI